MSEIKKWTGERLETFIVNNNTMEHLHRYALAIEYVRDKIVLDIACGEGYGSNLLSGYAKKVIGVDIDEATIVSAQHKYISENIEFKTGRVDQIPIEDNSIDIVISFETLEHHDKHLEMMTELKRVLKDGGMLLMSTPDKKYYTEKLGINNPFHLKELYYSEFKSLITSFFVNSQFIFQRMFNGSLIISENERTEFKLFRGNFKSISKEDTISPIYIIAMASDSQLPIYVNNSGFELNEISVQEQEQVELVKRIREESITWIKKSWSYRIGRAILMPFKIFKKSTRNENRRV
jgi:ubiquinone/menaquinone biosynthesis C-methylase UbiE